MIVGSLQNPKTHYPFTGGLSAVNKALNWLAERKNLSAGEHSIQGCDIYAIIAKKRTKRASQISPESHEEYYDIHIVEDGPGEIIQVTPTEKMKMKTPYNKAKDVTLYKHGPAAAVVLLTPGIFVICAPGDAHTPGVMIGKKAQDNIKVVIKIHRRLIPRWTYAHRR